MNILIENYSLLLEEFRSKFVLTKRTQEQIVNFMNDVDKFLETKGLPPLQNRLRPEDLHITFIYSQVGDEPEDYVGHSKSRKFVYNTPNKDLTGGNIEVPLDLETPISFNFGDYLVIRLARTESNPIVRMYNETMAKYEDELPSTHKKFKPHISFAKNKKSSNNSHVYPFRQDLFRLLKKNLKNIFVINTEIIGNDESKTKAAASTVVSEEGEGTPATNTTSDISSYSLPLTPILQRNRKQKKYFYKYK